MYEIRNDKLLKEAYESGRREALNEQYQGPPQFIRQPVTTPSGKFGVLPDSGYMKPSSQYQGWKKVDFWREFMRLRGAGNTQAASRLLQHMVGRGFLTAATASQLTTAMAQYAAGTLSAAGLSSLLVTLGLSALIVGIIMGAIVEPGFAGLTTISPSIPKPVLQQRYPSQQQPGSHLKPSH